MSHTCTEGCIYTPVFARARATEVLSQLACQQSCMSLVMVQVQFRPHKQPSVKGFLVELNYVSYMYRRMYLHSSICESSRHRSSTSVGMPTEFYVPRYGSSTLLSAQATICEWIHGGAEAHRYMYRGEGAAVGEVVYMSGPRRGGSMSFLSCLSRFACTGRRSPPPRGAARILRVGEG